MAEAREKLKIVYMGTPDFAATVLSHLLAWEDAEVLAVYTQPDRPCGRGLECRPSAVKSLALEHGLPVFQPLNFKAEEDVRQLAALQPDVLVVAAYGLILPQCVLDIAPRGAVNVHASLLPRYRGAAPIQRAIMNGDAVTGVTIMQMEAGLDSGPMLLQRATGIGITDTAATMHDELADLGGRLLVEALGRMMKGELVPMEQNHEAATHAPKLTKADGEIVWNRPAREVDAHIRGVHPWPGAFFALRREGHKTLRVGIEPGCTGDAVPEGVKPGTVTGMAGDRLAIACADRLYLVSSLRPASRKPMTASAFYCGYLAECTLAECVGLDEC
ncbi:methionyl-tRNA formyltransferase [Oleidesulfovibrio alaskensis G20]|jgi:methionyl-tRNA formyltransferase|uniref:Methionyl-tRNA formyltransferase n=1 Tax=Oleidesulfovibrio alaskensis (strain ATCC BAA-1058 / DSM 17464 / G20) TaxID=207559 RepID=Q317R1_OLEA2|nr:methionyl-tRNA formyltransferase [Oleidesulfovibrio alaskensis]ABB36815.1 methionyl-tRNA formyltransferase [Oleidesulfovibrio alaskensis G20]MBG0774709.1 methionyl-tRNA formyltransferase [Oleidesulfovibrio alaskensis]MBL3583465.1 methionyl-tRNA formyltransferase [Oleidesulfovibrio alaskensis]